ncbi:MAG: hypothetical protein ACE5IL_15960 [Myxococcota bacterium]
MERIRERFEEYCQAILRSLWRFRTGRDAALDLEPTDDAFGDVTAGGRIPELAGLAESASFATERDAARRLRIAHERAFVARRTRALRRECLEAEVHERLRVADREASYAGWRLRAAAETDAELRARIAEILDAADQRLLDRRCELGRRAGEAFAELGYASPAAFARAAWPTLDVEGWTAQAARLLDATEALHHDGQRLRMEALGSDPARANRADVLRLRRLAPFEREQATKRPGAVLAMLVRDLDVRLESSLTLDLELRPRKDWRSFCLAPRIPGEIGVSVLPGAGYATLVELLRRAGEGLALAFCAGSLPVERRRCGDPGLEALWGELFCARTSDPGFSDELLAGPLQEPWLRAARAERLAQIRTVAARVDLELEHASLPGSEDPATVLERFAQALSWRSGIALRPASVLADLDVTEPLRSLHRLRGACLEVRLAEWLRLEFGERFWRARRAGELLKELWNTGTTYDLDGLACELGLGEISVDPLIESLLS